MNLYERLNEIEKKNKLNKNLKLRIKCVDNAIIEGYFDGYTDALDNDPEITQLEISGYLNYTGITSILETEIESIEVIE